MKSFSSPRLANCRAFTLIEMLVAVTVLAMLVVLLAQLTGLSSRSLTDQNSRSENFAKARSALDLMSTDIGMGVFREDVGAFRDANGVFAPAFYTRRQGVGGDRALTLICYRVDSQANLLRASHPILWNDALGLGFADATKIPLYAQVLPAEYDEVMSGILRQEFYFINQDGQFSNDCTSQARAIGIAIAVLDERSLKLAQQSGELQRMAGDLLRQTSPSQSYARYWGAIIANPDFFQGQPQPVRANLRVFERVVPFPAR